MRIVKIVLWTFLGAGILMAGVVIYALATFKMTRLW